MTRQCSSVPDRLVAAWRAITAAPSNWPAAAVTQTWTFRSNVWIRRVRRHRANAYFVRREIVISQNFLKLFDQFLDGGPLCSQDQRARLAYRRDRDRGGWH